MRVLSLILLCFICLDVLGQLPKTNIWLMQIKKNKDSLVIGKSVSISNNNRYNNQARFSLNSKSLFFVSADSTGSTDIYNYDLRSGKTKAITHTGLSEYSPQELKPDILYAVVVEKDSTQRIHQINAISGIHEKILEPDSVGYYCFLNDDTLIYYKLTNPHSLQVYFLNSKKELKIGDFPGRGFLKTGTNTLLYCLKDSTYTEVYRYNFNLSKATLICKYPGPGEDIYWHPQLGLLRSESTQILQFHESTKEWQILFELKNYGLHLLTRFAIDEQLKYLVVVDNY